MLEDDEVVRRVLGELLQSLGHDAEFAPHGMAAIEKYRQARESGSSFEIVILDLTIRGGLGGLETLNALREIDPGVKAVVSSGYSADETLTNYLNKGFKAVLKKPYGMQELKETLDSLLGG